MAVMKDAGDRLARFNAWILAAGAALAGANASVVIATSGLVGRALTGEMKLATIPVLTFVIGTAASAFPAAFSMRRFGRRNGFAGGALFGVVAGLLGATAIVHGEFRAFLPRDLLGRCLPGLCRAISLRRGRYGDARLSSARHRTGARRRRRLGFRRHAARELRRRTCGCLICLPLLTSRKRLSPLSPSLCFWRCACRRNRCGRKRAEGRLERSSPMAGSSPPCCSAWFRKAS